RKPQQLFVKRDDLSPIRFSRGLRFGVYSSDSGLELIVSDSPQTQRALNKIHPFIDLSCVPARAVLFLECHQLAVVVHTSVTSRILQKHQREQADVFRLVWQQLAKYAS